MKKTITHLTLLLSVGALWLSGCATPPPTTPRVGISSQIEKKNLTCAIIADKSLCAPNALTLNYSGKYADVMGPRADLSSCVLKSSEDALKGLFTTVPVITPRDQATKADLFVIPRVLHTFGTVKNLGFGDSTFTVDLSMTFLDDRKIPLFEVFTHGEMTSSYGSGWTANGKAVQRAYDAIGAAMTTLAEVTTTNQEYAFFFSHRDFFAMDDTAKREALSRVLPVGDNNSILSLMLITYATRGAHAHLLDALLERGISPNAAYGAEGLFLMHYAALYNNASAIARLTAAGGNVNQRDKHGRLPIFYSAWNAKKEATKALLAQGSEIDIFDQKCPA